MRKKVLLVLAVVAIGLLLLSTCNNPEVTDDTDKVKYPQTKFGEAVLGDSDYPLN